jgi:hypothetical protein
MSNAWGFANIILYITMHVNRHRDWQGCHDAVAPTLTTVLDGPVHSWSGRGQPCSQHRFRLKQTREPWKNKNNHSSQNATRSAVGMVRSFSASLNVKSGLWSRVLLNKGDGQ